MIRENILLVLLFALSFGVFSQNGWDWGSDKIAATRKYQYLTTYMQAKRYQDCREATFWLMKNAPNLNVDLYKRASVVYKECAKSSIDSDLTVVQDSAMLIYDLWVDRFGTDQNTSTIFNKKSLIYYRYLKGRSAINLDSLASFYKKTLELNKGKTYLRSIEYYMEIANRQKSLGSFSTDQLFGAYNLSLATTTAKKEVKKDNDAELKKIDKLETKLLKSVMSSINMNCDEIISFFAPKMQIDPQNADLANTARKFLDQSNCNESDLYFQSVKVVTEQNPSVDRFLYLAGLEQNRKRIDSALDYLEKALILASSKEQESDIYLQIAQLYNSQADKSRARINAEKSAAKGFNLSKSYTLIGDLYYNSGEDCTNEDELISRSIYIAAYLEYQKAGNANKMAIAKQQFPSMEDIFVRSKKIGDIVNTGCWINESVPLKKR
jgi:tetratricopeptide (TPR) repeat protein